MKKQVPPSIVISVIVLLVAGISAYYYSFMRQKVKYTEMQGTMIPTGIGTPAPSASGDGSTTPSTPEDSHPSTPISSDNSAPALARLIAGLNSLKSDGAGGLKKEQTAKILPLLKTLQTSTEPINEEKCKATLTEIESALTDDQKKAVEESGQHVTLDEKEPLKTEAVRRNLDELVKRLEQAGA